MTLTKKITTSIIMIAVFSLMTTSLSYQPQEAFATNHLTYAVSLENYNEGTGVIDARDDPSQALGPEDYTGVTSGDPLNFVSLGNEGSITLSFLEPVGGSVVVFEGTNGGSNTSWGKESTNVEVSSDGTTWTSIGEASNKQGTDPSENDRTISTLEIPSELGCIQFVKLTDTSPAPGTGDNFDVDAVGITGDVVCLPPLEICEDDTMDLIAGQHIDSGDVTVVSDGTTLWITIQTQDDWQLSESHVQIGEDMDDFPLTKKGSPKVGNFDYQREYNPLVTEDTYEFLLTDLGLESVDTITFAVHTVVVQTDLDGEIIAEETAWKQGDRFVQKGNWAMYNTYDIQECDVIE